MSILKSLGFGRKKLEPKLNIEFHSDCMSRYGSLVTAFLNGAAIEVMNPHNGNWEKCDQPVFDPSYDYRLSVVPYVPLGNVGVAPLSPTPPPTVDYPFTPAPECIYKRGDVYKTESGLTYLVLGNKYDLIVGYDPTIDPDSNPLVVMRYDSGKKKAVSCRDLNGHRADNSSVYSLINKVTTSPLVDAEVNHTGNLLLYVRSGYKDVYLDTITGEILFR